MFILHITVASFFYSRNFPLQTLELDHQQRKQMSDLLPDHSLYDIGYSVVKDGEKEKKKKKDEEDEVFKSE